ncbi:MAG: hypothetical protein LWW92_04045 [Rhodocyclales bacterium]|nr:hypothetical protein [Rhodocyclales bacterium]
MSTAHIYLKDDEIADFVQETKNETQYFYGQEGYEYGVCPYISFYVFHDQKKFLSVANAAIDILDELKNMADLPFASVCNPKTANWVVPTDANMSLEYLRKQAIWHHENKELFILGATDMDGPECSACWAFSSYTSRVASSYYSFVKITFRDSWYQKNKSIWNDFVLRCISRLQPEHCYSGYEIGTTTMSVFGAYESDVMERICADYFYGVDIDHPPKMDYHARNSEDGWAPRTKLGGGLRTPTWCFMLSPYWRKKLGKSVSEVKQALSHPDIHIIEIPYASAEGGADDVGLWIRMGELSLYPVEEGVPELLTLGSALIKPIRCDLLQLFTLHPWEGDPNPRFDFENGPLWMARFDPDSQWPTPSARAPMKFSPTGDDLRCPAGAACPRSGIWWTPADSNARRAFLQGEEMPDFPESTYGATIWYRESEQRS